MRVKFLAQEQEPLMELELMTDQIWVRRFNLSTTPPLDFRVIYPYKDRATEVLSSETDFLCVATANLTLNQPYHMLSLNIKDLYENVGA